MKQHDLKRKCLKWHISAAGTHLNLGENFENWCTEIPHKLLRPYTPNANRGDDPRNVFLPLYFSSWILTIAVFLPWTASCQKRNTTVTANIRHPEQILPGEVLQPVWDTTSPLTHGRNNLVLQLFRSINACKNDWLSWKIITLVFPQCQSPTALLN